MLHSIGSGYMHLSQPDQLTWSAVRADLEDMYVVGGIFDFECSFKGRICIEGRLVLFFRK